MVFFSTYPLLVNYVLSTFVCKDLDSTKPNEKYLLADPDVLCYEAKHYTYMSIGLIGTLFWVVGVPFLLYIRLNYLMNIYLQFKDVDEYIDFSFTEKILLRFAADYKDEKFYWESLLYLRKFLLVFFR